MKYNKKYKQPTNPKTQIENVKFTQLTIKVCTIAVPFAGVLQKYILNIRAIIIRIKGLPYQMIQLLRYDKSNSR